MLHSVFDQQISNVDWRNFAMPRTTRRVVPRLGTFAGGWSLNSYTPRYSTQCKRSQTLKKLIDVFCAGVPRASAGCIAHALSTQFCYSTALVVDSWDLEGEPRMLVIGRLTFARWTRSRRVVVRFWTRWLRIAGLCIVA